MKEVRLIGGRLNGTLATVEDNARSAIFLVNPRLPSSFNPEEVIPSIPQEDYEETYAEVEFDCDGSIVKVWAPFYWTSLQVLNFLIESHGRYCGLPSVPRP